ARDGIRLHAETVGPERVRYVERGHVEGDERVIGYGEVARLEAAVARIAKGPLPLLADHLDRERVAGPLRLVGRVRPLTAARPVRARDERVAAPRGERDDDRTGNDDPEKLRSRVPLDRRAVDDGRVPTPPNDERVDEDDPDEEHDRDEQSREDNVCVRLCAGFG